MKYSEYDKKFWLIIHPYVYISIQNKQFLMLNTLNRQYIKSSDIELFSLVRQINSRDNGYVIKILNEAISENIKTFINEIRNKFIGDLIDSSLSMGRPVQFYPKLFLEKIQEEMTFKVKASKLLKNDVIKGFTKEISIYINSLCHQNCNFCSSAYLQFDNCYKTANKNNLSIDNIKRIVNEFNGSSLEKIKILGGNVVLHPEFESIVDFFDKIPLKIEYFLNYLNAENNIKDIKKITNKKNKLNLIVHFPINRVIFETMLVNLKAKKNHVFVKFIIDSEKQFKESKQISQEFKLKNSVIIPHYNKKNLKFFEKFIFLTEESIIKGKTSLNQIFANQVLNQKNFKNMIITSDNKVYANLNLPCLGIADDKIMDLMVKEINKGESWYNTRNKVTPCKNCIYQDVCPPISNYEYYMNKYNVCHV